MLVCVCGVICVYALNVRGVLCDPPHIDKLFWFNIHFHMAVQMTYIQFGMSVCGIRVMKAGGERMK